MSSTFVPIEALRCRGPAAAGAPAAPLPPPWMHVVPGPRPLVFVVADSQLYEIAPELHARVARGDPESLAELRAALPPAALPVSHGATIADPAPPVSLSLNVAQACNLSCAYCYADEGRFGGSARLMAPEIALAAIDRLIAGAAGRRVTIGFIGGEPFLNRPLIQRAVAHARAQARAAGVSVGFSVTTNATLLTAEDLALLRANGFVVTVSLDGIGVGDDRHRRARRGSSGALALAAIQPLLDDPGRARVAARVTIARDDLRVLERIEGLGAAGFREVGVSPLRTSALEALALGPDDWPAFLAEMIRAADSEWARVRRGGDWRFSNLAVALKELHRGSCRPLPCGAAAGYVSLGAEGGYFTCHRAVDDPKYRIGDLAGGLDQAARARFLSARHVDCQEPCRSCWARYLCGGGCHVEVLAAGRTGCDYIRGWLDYCLALYDRVLMERPDLLGPDESRSRP